MLKINKWIVIYKGGIKTERMPKRTAKRILKINPSAIYIKNMETGKMIQGKNVIR